MIAPASLAEYAQPYKRYFYQFEEYGEVIAIPAGRTICYTQFLLETLESLVNRGAPPLGTLLLAIIATGIDAESMLPQVSAIIESTDVAKASGKEVPFLNTAFKFLETLSSLPSRYRHGAQRLQVLQTIFLNAHNTIAARRIKGFLNEYQEIKGMTAHFFPFGTLTPGVLTRDLRPLAQLHYKFRDVDALLQGLAAAPELPDIPFEPEPLQAEMAAPRDFIEELERHSDTFHVASLVRRIWSGLAIPFHSNHPSTQPLGGIADITNRGALDRLLLSEHANEDILFLSRLANGEALYINREAPPETAGLQRILLIDSSLQAWGTPRALSYALLLAIAHHPKTDIDCIAYAVGRECSSIAFSTIHEVIDSLQLLDAGLNAAPGLDAFLSEKLPKVRTELFFLTSPQGMKQAAVQQLMSMRGMAITYCVTASEEGECTVYKRSGAGMRHLQSFTLPLDKLWEKQPKDKLSSAPKETPAGLPSAYPVLFATPQQMKQLLTTDSGRVLMITKGKSILQHTAEGAARATAGWSLVMEHLPGGHCMYEAGENRAGQQLLLSYIFEKHEVHIFNLNTKEHASTVVDMRTKIQGTPPFLFYDDAFYLLGGTYYHRFALQEPAAGDAALIVQTREDTSPEIMMRQHYRKRQDELKELKVPPASHGGVLKYLKQAFIDTDGRLVINHHYLAVINDRFLQFCPGASASKIHGLFDGKTRVAFQGGSSITINPNGMFTLKSSNPEIPEIYIPSVLGGPVGAGTHEHFAGNPYYNPGILHPEKVLPLTDFYQQYIQAFIQQISKDATPVTAS